MKFGCWAAPQVAIPWLNDLRFLELHEQLHGKTLVSMDRCWMLYSMARHRSSVPGVIAECGVYQGGTAYLLAAVAKEQRKPIYLFDTFSGIPAGTPGIDTHYVKGGKFSDTSKDSVEAYVRPVGASLRIYAGTIPGTFEGLENELFSFVHLDLDIYSSIMESLKFFYQRLAPGGVIMLDDYGFEECQGARIAADEFGQVRGVPPVVLPTGQAFFISL